MPRPPETSALDERLVQVALGLLRERGVEGLSLREIARRAGVSHGAPQRHFRGLSHLLAEVAARGFDELSEAVAKAAAQLPPGAGPAARLRAAGRAYVERAVASPGLFALMFRPDALEAGNAKLRARGGAAFELLVSHVRAAQDAGWQPERDTRLLAGAAWAAMHGLASLWSQGAFPAAIPGATLDRSIALALDLNLSDPDGGTT